MISDNDGPMVPVPVDDPLRLAWFECNDYGNGRRLEALAKGKLKWVDDKAWIAWDDKRWSEREGPHRARQLAHEVAMHLHDEAAALGELIGDPKDPDAAALRERFGEWCTPARALDRLTLLHRHAVKSGNANATTNMLLQARDLATMRAWSEDFDKDPLTYNVQNGTLRFRLNDKGKWVVKWQKGHEPRDMLMQIANVVFDPKAECPQWKERLEFVQPNPDVRSVFPRMYGQTLTGLTDCEEFYVHKGRGGDGKTKTHEILCDLHGDYYRHSPVKTFLQASFQKSGSEHRSDLVRLSGDIRFVLCDEPPPRVTWDGETIKQVTGGGTLTARGSGEKTELTFKPRWKLFVEVNPLPSMPSDDKGFRRRFRLILWEVDIRLTPAGFEPPAQLRERLLSEKSGILNWMIEGCLEWLGDRRVPMPEVEAEALNDFWAQASPLGEWIDARCDLTDREAVTPSKVLLDDFKAWMERNDFDEEQRKKWNATKFGRDLTQRQIIGTKDRRGNKVRRGIKFREEDPFTADGAMSPADRSSSGSAEPTAIFGAEQAGGGSIPDEWSGPGFDDDLLGDD